MQVIILGFTFAIQNKFRFYVFDCLDNAANNDCILDDY